MISPRLTRAAFTFLLFGTAAALLPSQNTTALAENGCFTGPAGSSGQLAIAPNPNAIQNAYTLVPTATNYYIFFKPDAASPYAQLATGSSKTAFVINSGQVAVNGTAYSTSNPSSTTASSFTAAQAAIRNFSGVVTGYAAGSMTVTCTYMSTDSQGNQTKYTAIATFSTP